MHENYFCIRYAQGLWMREIKSQICEDQKKFSVKTLSRWKVHCCNQYGNRTTAVVNCFSGGLECFSLGGSPCGHCGNRTTIEISCFNGGWGRVSLEESLCNRYWNAATFEVMISIEVGDALHQKNHPTDTTKAQPPLNLCFQP